MPLQRHGRPEELLAGPTLYGISISIMTIVYWRDSPAGVIAISILCGGDGMADVVGRAWGHRVWGALPYNKSKVRILHACMIMLVAALDTHMHGRSWMINTAVVGAMYAVCTSCPCSMHTGWSGAQLYISILLP